MTDYIPPSDPEGNPFERSGEPSGPPAQPAPRPPAGGPPTAGRPAGEQPAGGPGESSPPSTWGQAPQPSNWGAQAPAETPYPGANQNYHEPYANQYGGQASYPYGEYPRASNATTALMFAVAGLFCCGFPAFVGTIMAKGELNAINRGETDPSAESAARAGFVVGLIASILWLGMAALWVLGTIVSLAAGA